MGPLDTMWSGWVHTAHTTTAPSLPRASILENFHFHCRWWAGGLVTVCTAVR